MAFIMRGMDFGGIKSSPHKSNGNDAFAGFNRRKRQMKRDARRGIDSTGGDASWSRKEIRRERKRRIRLSKQGPKYLEDGTKNPNWGMYGGEKARKYGRGGSGKRLQQRKKSYIKNIKKMRKPVEPKASYINPMTVPGNMSGGVERLRPKGGIYKAGVDYVIDPIKKIPDWISKWSGGGGGGSGWFAKLKGDFLSGKIK